MFRKKLNSKLIRQFCDKPVQTLILVKQEAHHRGYSAVVSKATRESLLQQQFCLKREKKEFFSFEFSEFDPDGHYGYVYMWFNKLQSKINICARHKNLFKEDYLTNLPQVAKLIRLCPQDWEFSVLHFNTKINDEKETFRLGQEELNKFSVEDCGHRLYNLSLDIKYSRQMSDEARTKMSASHMNRVKSPETRQKISEANKGKHSKPKSEETKRKISEGLKRKYEMDGPRKQTSEETREKMRIAKLGKKREGSPIAKGKPLSEDVKLKISESLKGRKLTEEHKENVRKAMLGLKKSKIHKENIKKAREKYSIEQKLKEEEPNLS